MDAAYIITVLAVGSVLIAIDRIITHPPKFPTRCKVIGDQSLNAGDVNGMIRDYIRAQRKAAKRDNRKREGKAHEKGNGNSDLNRDLRIGYHPHRRRKG